MVKMYENISRKIKDLIRSANNNTDDYDKKYMKIKYQLDDVLPLKKH